MMKDWNAKMLLAHPYAAHISREIIEKFVEHKNLEPCKSLEWICLATRVAVHFATHSLENIKAKKSNSELKAEFEQLSNRIAKLHNELFNKDLGIHDSVWEYGWFGRDEPNMMGEPDRFANYEPPVLRRMNEAITELDWLSNFMRDVAGYLGNNVQQPRWRDAEIRAVRIKLALFLTEVFETGFGKPATLNKWDDGTPDLAFGIWSEFYVLVHNVSFRKSRVPDLEGVLSEARKKYLASPVIFLENFSIEYPP